MSEFQSSAFSCDRLTISFTDLLRLLIFRRVKVGPVIIRTSVFGIHAAHEDAKASV